MLEGLAGVRLRKEEVDRSEKKIREITGWDDLVKEKTGFVEAACQNYEVLVEDNRAGKAGGWGSQRYETRFGPKQNDVGIPDAPDRTKRAGVMIWQDSNP
mgnify:CR=1 FL=1